MRALLLKNKICGLFKRIKIINRQYGCCRLLNLSYYFELKKRIKLNEGFAQNSYKDQLGFLTIGYGHLIKKNEKHLIHKKSSKKFLDTLFEQDFLQAVSDFNHKYKKNKYSKSTKEVIIEMIFQLGVVGQKKFIKMNKHINNKSFFMAALEMKKSLWYKQTPKRVDLLIKHLLSYDR